MCSWCAAEGVGTGERKGTKKVSSTVDPSTPSKLRRSHSQGNSDDPAGTGACQFGGGTHTCRVYEIKKRRTGVGGLRNERAAERNRELGSNERVDGKEAGS